MVPADSRRIPRAPRYSGDVYKRQPLGCSEVKTIGASLVPSAIISNFYGRAGYVHLNNGETGSITFIGTVSPAEMCIRDRVKCDDTRIRSESESEQGV